MADEKVRFLPVDVYNFLGQEIGIRSNSDEVLSHIRSMYGRFYRRSDDEPLSRRIKWEDVGRPGMQIIDKLTDSSELFINDKHYLYHLSMVDGYSHFTSQNLQTSAEDLSGFCDPLTLIQSSLLTTIAIEAKEHHLIHAGVVSRHNRGMIFSATSGMGKTTLVLKLVDRGCKFLSDEVACFNLGQDLLEPFPRKLNIRAESEELLGLSLGSDAAADSMEPDGSERMLDIEEIVPGSISDQCSPNYIIFLRGFGEKPRLEQVSGSNAVFELLNSYIGPIENPAALLFEFAPVFNNARCFNLVLGNPDETAELVLKLVDEEKTAG